MDQDMQTLSQLFSNLFSLLKALCFIALHVRSGLECVLHATGIEHAKELNFLLKEDCRWQLLLDL